MCTLWHLWGAIGGEWKLLIMEVDVTAPTTTDGELKQNMYVHTNARDVHVPVCIVLIHCRTTNLRPFMLQTIRNSSHKITYSLIGRTCIGATHKQWEFLDQGFLVDVTMSPSPSLGGSNLMCSYSNGELVSSWIASMSLVHDKTYRRIYEVCWGPVSTLQNRFSHCFRRSFMLSITPDGEIRCSRVWLMPEKGHLLITTSIVLEPQHWIVGTRYPPLIWMESVGSIVHTICNVWIYFLFKSLRSWHIAAVNVSLTDVCRSLKKFCSNINFSGEITLFLWATYSHVSQQSETHPNNSRVDSWKHSGWCNCAQA